MQFWGIHDRHMAGLSRVSIQTGLVSIRFVITLNHAVNARLVLKFEGAVLGAIDLIW
jgi:hypothetical protein